MKTFIIAALAAFSMASAITVQASPRQAPFNAAAVFERAAQGSSD